MAKSHHNVIFKNKLKNRGAPENFHHEIPSGIANNRDITQQNQDYSRKTINLTKLATLLLCLAVMFETWSKFEYVEFKELPHIADHKTILLWKYGLENLFIIVFILVEFFMVLVRGDDTSDSTDLSSFKSYQIMSLINILAILLLGLASDLMPFGDEGNPFLTWKKFWQTANNDKFSYSLTHCFDPNYNLNDYQNGAPDFYNIAVNLNRVLNYTEIDQFLTNHNCTVDDLASFLRSIRSFFISSIYC